MRSIECCSRLRALDRLNLPGNPSVEPSFVAATCDSVRKHAGEVVQRFMDRVNEQGWKEGSYLLYIYNKTLFPGTWPIGSAAWHVDAQGGSDPARITDLPLDHLMCSVNYGETEDQLAEEVGTEFVTGTINFQIPDRLSPPEKYKYPWWHSQIERQVQEGALKSERIKDRTLYAFDSDSFHRTPWMSKPGRRLLMSATRIAAPTRLKLMTAVNEPLDLKNLAYIPLADGSGWAPVQMVA